MSDVFKASPATTLNDLLKNALGVNSHPGPESGTQSITAVVSKILSNNPNRVGLTFSNLSPNTIFLWIENTVGVGQGIFLSANGGTVGFDWRVDMTLISNDWYAVAPAGASNLSILEVVTS